MGKKKKNQGAENKGIVVTQITKRLKSIYHLQQII